MLLSIGNCYNSNRAQDELYFFRMGERPPAISGQCNYPPLLAKAGRSVSCPPIMDKTRRQQDRCQDCQKVIIGRQVRSDFLLPDVKIGETAASEIRESSMAQTYWTKNRNR